MLLELRLRNVAVIEAVTLPLAGGLNVLTGETGAGKSLIVGALGLLLGERAGADRLRAGADRAVVEATFALRDRPSVREWLDEHGLDADDDVLILKREIAATGRSRAWVNGSSVTVAVLRELGTQLVAVHGQHEAQQLLDAAAQRSVLDAFAGADAESVQVTVAHDAVLRTQRELDALAQRQRDVTQRADYLRFLTSEISAAAVQVGEEESVEAEHRRLSHAEELRESTNQAAELLQGDHASVLSQLTAVRRALSSAQRIDAELEQLQPAFDSAYFALEELARELSTYAEDIDADPERLRTLDTRRAVLHQLVRKYGPTLEDVLRVASEAEAELALVDDASATEDRLRRDAATARELRTRASAVLSRKRQDAAGRLASAVSALLPALGMAGGAFAVQLEPLDEPGAHGAEHIRFVVALNAGSEMGTLDRVASGGELSRVMLALSTVLARLQSVPTLVFDEVDAGVGGNVAWQVGALMRGVAEHHQVLAISHLAQIAACAHHHVVVRKQSHESGGLTTADTAVICDEQRVVELARMLGGDADREVSRAHARELMERGQSVRPDNRFVSADDQAETVRADATRPAKDARRAVAAQRRGKPG